MRRLTPRTRGFTLIELLVAIAVLSIGTLATLRATDQSARALGQAMPRLLAQIAAENRAQEMQLGGRGGPSTVQLGPETITLEVSTLPTEAGLVEARIRAVSQSGPGALLVTYLPAPGAGR